MTSAPSRAGLERLLRPAHIAVFGGRFAERVVAQCRRAGFTGEIWPVHPERREILGCPAVRSVAELPGAPDAAFIGVNRHATVRLVAELGERGCGGAVCYASGFAEVDEEGARLQRELVRAAGTMPLLGPNCYGFINYLDGALLWPDQHGGVPVSRGVAVITQSSNMAINITMNRRALPLAYVLTVGNQATVGIAELVAALARDGRVSAIGVHVEALDDVCAFAGAVAEARGAGVPVVALAMGRSEQGRALAVSHTASLAGSDAVLAAFLDRLGVARLGSLPELLETLKLLHAAGPLAGNALVSLSCSGGEAGLMADAAHGRRLEFRPFTSADEARIRSTLNPLVTLSNPFDYHTFDWGSRERLTDTFTAVLQSSFDLAMLVLDLPRGDRCDDSEWQLALQALADARTATGGAAAVVTTLPELMPEDEAARWMERGLVPLLGVDEAMAAAEAAAFAGRAPAPFRPWPVSVRPPREPAATLGEFEAKRMLAGVGVRIPRGALCATELELDAALSELHFPLVAKASAPDLAHKSEHHGVRLGLADTAAVREAFGALRPMGTAVLVEEMVSDGVVELIVGVSRDPVVGLHLALGLGGVLAEALRDVAIVPLPATAGEIHAALEGLRGSGLLHGYRGRAAADVDAVVQTALAVQSLVDAERDTLMELDINPLIVRPAGYGAVAVDALIRRSANADEEAS